MPSSQQRLAVGGNMGFSTTDWVALFILGACALGCTFRKRLVRIIGLAVMPFAFAGLLMSLSHHERAPGQLPTVPRVVSLLTTLTTLAKLTMLTTPTTKGLGLIFLT